MRLELLEKQTDECIDATSAKQFCRVDITADDTLITNLFIPAARQFASDFINGSIIPIACVAWYDFCKDKYELKRSLTLPHTRIIEVTSVKNYDEENVATVFATSNYFVSGNRIVLNHNADWEFDVRDYDSLKVEFISGWGEYQTIDDVETLVQTVPENIKLAMNMMVAHWLEQREATSEVDFKNVPMGATALLSPYRNIAL
ncbi:MAG TPA: head-tail connector protein [Hanamia sp.]|jgi:phage conserved hypothetical protein, phiE125 gp8 family|nr:head-tail connector protein [Hanamia sp.]